MSSAPSSPLNFPSSSDADPDEAQQDPATPVRAGGNRAQRQLFVTPSPLPGSAQKRGSTVARRALGLPVTPMRGNGAPSSDGSPLNFPSSSSPVKRGSDTAATPQGARGERPLFRSPTPSVVGTPVRNQRGDIHPHSGLSPELMERIKSSASRRSNLAPVSSEPDLAYPSSGPDLTAQAPPTDNPEEAIKVIWGTNVSILESMAAFTDFLRNFRVKYRIQHDRSRNVHHPAQLDPENGERRLYQGYLRTMRLTSQTSLNLDTTNLAAYPPTKKLYNQLLKYPQELVPIMDHVLKDCMIQLAQDDLDDELARGDEGYTLTQDEVDDMNAHVYMVRPFGFEAVNMRNLNPSDTDKLCCIKGLVIRATPVIPDMKTAFFRCLTCSHTMQVGIDRGRISEPSACPREVCGSVGTMSLIHNRSQFADRQVIRLQETPDVVPDGQTPHTVSLCVYDELVDLAKPGDRITVTGVFRSVPVRVNPRQRTVKSLFKTYIDVVHIQRGDGKRLGLDKTTRAGDPKIPGVAGGVGIGGDMEDEIIIGADGYAQGLDSADGRSRAAVLEDKLKELSQREDLYEYLARSLAPSIWEMDDVKKGILLQLFGGANKTVERGGGGGGPRYRGDINVLLVGDPGTSKSQILGYVHKIAPRGVYTSGKGSSAVGLTAYVTRDPDTKQLVLESGALVLSDGGVCCIDEFDKMSDATRSVLHEVMEQQTVSIAKAGIITTLNARTSILAAANPVQSKYNPNWPIARNIDLPPTLISRFDLLYLVLDRVDESLDRQLAQHLVGLYLEDAPVAAALDFLPIEMLTAYITYARDHINPVITEAAGNELVASYVAMRRVGEDSRSSERRITATTRQLESLIRLSEAHARMRLSKLVELKDVEEASRLMREAIRASATDPVTGLIDIDLLNTGAGQQQRKLHADLKREITAAIDGLGTKSVRWADMLKSLNEQSTVQIDVTEFSTVVRELETEGILKVSGERDRRTLRKARND